jgi:alpha-glucosidase
MKPINYYLIPILLLLITCCSNKENEYQIQSPNNNIELIVSLCDNGSLEYVLRNENRELIEKSSLGLIFKETSFASGLEIVDLDIYPTQTEEYTMLVGKKLKNTARWNEMNIVLLNEDGYYLKVEFRVYDEGLAFRYSFSESPVGTITLVKETTSFKVSIAGKKWIHPYDTVASWGPAYESIYENGISVGTPSPSGKNGWAFPVLFNIDTDWILLTESNLGSIYAGMHLDDNPLDGVYTLRLPEELEAYEKCSSQPTMSLPFKTPWRVIIISDGLEGIVQSNLVFHVSQSQLLNNTDWIKPGRSSWSWWSENSSPRDYSKLKEYVDFSAAMGWEYSLVDANWNEMRGGSLDQLADYANEMGVGLLVWYNSGGTHNVKVHGPRDIMDDTFKRRAEFAKISGWGIKGVKVDFFHSDKDCIIRLYHDILKDAADFNLIVNFHGSTLPRGWERTYPNMITIESVRGAESYIFDSRFPDVAPVQNTILPFTRNVVGTMDYTPVTFSDNRFTRKTTNAHELALAVVFESGIQHFADNYQSYLEQPGYVLDYLKKVPTVWDETKLIDGYPGEMAILARKSGVTWYISGVSGLSETKPISLSLNFLNPGDYIIDLISDGSTDRTFNYEKRLMSTADELDIIFRPYGGFAAVLRKQ